MIVSSRTPEGLPSECPLCGANANIEFSDPAKDAPCPKCGHLLWASAQLLQSVAKLCEESFGTDAGIIKADTPFEDVDVGSLDTIEMVMELEEKFDINIPDDAAEQIQTIGDAVRFIQNHRRDRDG